MNQKKSFDFEDESISEKQFLSSYNIEEYDRPSVATDIIVLSMIAKESECHRKDAQPVLSVLLIKRGEHPFKNKWALPGGFLRNDETIEECALRELREESNIIPASIIPIGVFSNPCRDPRGRIISNAFASIVSEESIGIMSGSDTVDAQWFSLDFKRDINGEYTLSLKGETETLNVILKDNDSRFANTRFEEVSDSPLAFDHGKIIATAVANLKERSQDYNMIFGFLPEKFTLASLQKVQETLLGTTLLTANFRRKISGLVEETDEYTEGAGHRPARLFKRSK